MTRANVTGKVPVVIPRKGKVRGKTKPVKLSSNDKRHFNHLQKRGLISTKAAQENGLKGATK
jgi:hypothetical protein